METDVNRRTKADKARALVDRIAKKRNAPWPLKFARAFKRPIQACVSGLSWVRSGGRIGLAPIYSFTFGEDQRAAKAPLQTFASGVDRLQNKLSRLASVQLMQFEVLPIAVNVTTRRRAKMLRWLFGFDAVLWGSYVSTEPPQIAIQIETARPKPENDETAWSRAWRDLDLFGELSEIENEGIIIDQEDMLDAYVAIAVALVHALNARSSRHSHHIFASLDKLGVNSRKNRNAIVAALGFFPCLAFTALTFVAGRVAGFGSGLRFAGSAATLVTRVASDSVATPGLGVGRIGIPNSSAPSGACGLSSARASASSNVASPAIASSAAVRLAFRDSSSIFLAEFETRDFTIRFVIPYTIRCTCYVVNQ